MNLHRTGKKEEENVGFSKRTFNFPLRHIDLPVVAATVEHPGAPHPRRPVGPVGMEVGNPLLGTVQPHLVRFVVLVPGPVVLAPRSQRLR
jgi:hypothetical protein